MVKGLCPRCRTVVNFKSVGARVLSNDSLCLNLKCDNIIDKERIIWFKGSGYRIECAAIRVKETGYVYIGKRHHMIMQSVDEDCNRLILDCSSNAIDQGFITDAGEFVDRVEAGKIALACGQVKSLMSPPQLFSEDII